MRTALITGAGAGIGRATAIALAADGWRLALMGRKAAKLEETASACGGALVLPGDVGIAEDVERVFARLAAEWGRLDLLFNNAGIFLPAAPIDEIDVEAWLDLSRTNITGMVLCARAAFGLMRRQQPQGGRIINNGSVSAHAPRPGSAPYTISKHAVTGLTKSLALDGRRFGISCGQIDIGNAVTDMAAGFADGMEQADGSFRPEPMMDVGHVARTVAHMAAMPGDVNMPFVSIMARDMPWLGRG
ncbi:SDR family oxidoreductase [Pseudogemmobacter faecipullorum]|uniref:SDR family oxidoreductase n=1 Tax=Pseudogemmobacter faecipullorum TaxID=2755041 RepID=A0ABS8CII5_9RHOB|nr:SDR family oxidoreductase [Pseudogemmobacter faecipullorum]MCB5409193.1 SDR family oxidoreductase [Pseudogemmobacter faecipullorum]